MNHSDSEAVNAPDIKERLTLHVKKRITSGLNCLKNDSHESNGDIIIGHETIMLAVKKRPGKGKKKRGSKPSKKVKIKVEDMGDDYPEERSVSSENIRVTPINNTSGDADEFTSTGTEDTTPPELITPLKDSPEPSIQPKNSSDCNSCHGESVLNNTILSEVLNERKRALFESADILEYLRKKVNNA